MSPAAPAAPPSQAAERLAEFRARALDLLIWVSLCGGAVPMVFFSGMLLHTRGPAHLLAGWAGVVIMALLALFRRLPFRLRSWGFLLIPLVMLGMILPRGIPVVLCVHVALAAVFASLLLGLRAGIIYISAALALLLAAALLPPGMLPAGSPIPPEGPMVVALGLLPTFGGVLGVALLYRRLERGYEESVGLVRGLELSERRFRDVFEASPEATALVSLPDRRVFDCNAAFERLFGWPRGELVGRSAVEVGLLRATDSDLVLARVEGAGELDGAELTLRRRDGATVEAQVVVRRTELGGLPVLLVVVRDVTLQRHLEAAVRQGQRVETMGVLAGGIAHNFRNALGAILPNLDLCLESAPPELREPLEEARTAAAAAVALATRLTRMARREPTAPPAPVQLRPLLEDVLGICRATFGARIAIDAALETEGAVLADRGELHQVFLNLCLNARDAVADARSPRIAVALAGSPDGARLAVTVSDNGHGMDDETLKRVGEPFFTTKPEGQGTGLGLSSVFAAVRTAGGRVAISSRPGQGATFLVELPRHASAAPAREPAPVVPLRAGVRALVVDDDPLLLEALGRQLTALGLTVQPFTDPAAALADLRARPRAFDLLLTDVDMPGLSGAELAARAREAAPGLPVVVLTGTSERTIVPGVAAVLSKPATSAELAAAVSSCLGLDPASAA